MTERPILFSAPMVRANREDRKSQTRRLRGLAKINEAPDDYTLDGGEHDPLGWMWQHFAGAVTIRCPYGVPGDKLIFREAWRTLADIDRLAPRDIQQGTAIWYEADGPAPPVFGRLRPGMFMCRWMVRDTAIVVSARPERLQSITKADALAEGIQVLPLQSAADPSAWYQSAPGVHQGRTAVDSYRQLWDSLNGKTSPWVKNDWVWRVEYQRVKTGEAKRNALPRTVTATVVEGLDFRKEPGV